MFEDDGDLNIVGKVVKSAVKKHDEGGYDYLLIYFTDGTSLSVQEESQSGEFSVSLT